MRSLILLLALSLSSAASAAPLKTTDDTNALCSSAATKLAAGQTEAAFDLLAVHWPLPAEELKGLAYQTKSQLAMVASRYGDPLGPEFVRTTLAGRSFVQHTYIVKYTNHALRLTCNFYKPKDTWIVNGVHWDDQTGKLFEPTP